MGGREWNKEEERGKLRKTEEERRRGKKGGKRWKRFEESRKE